VARIGKTAWRSTPWAAMPRLRVPALIVPRGHGSAMLAYRDEGPRVRAAMRRFSADQSRS
jgi:hypothetical protein